MLEGGTIEGLITVRGFSLNNPGGVMAHNGEFSPYYVNKGKTAAEDGLVGSVS